MYKPAPPSSHGVGGKPGPSPELLLSPLGSAHDTAHIHINFSSLTSHVTNVREALLAHLPSTISGTMITLTTVERSAREISPWFLDVGAGAGISAGGRPAKSRALTDLERGEAGVRVASATGRTCSRDPHAARRWIR